MINIQNNTGINPSHYNQDGFLDTNIGTLSLVEGEVKFIEGIGWIARFFTINAAPTNATINITKQRTKNFGTCGASSTSHPIVKQGNNEMIV